MVQYNRHIQRSFSRIEITTDDFQSNQPQVKSSTVKSAPSQNGLKMKVKSATYSK